MDEDLVTFHDSMRAERFERMHVEGREREREEQRKRDEDALTKAREAAAAAENGDPPAEEEATVIKLHPIFRYDLSDHELQHVRAETDERVIISIVKEIEHVPGHRASPKERAAVDKQYNFFRKADLNVPSIALTPSELRDAEKFQSLREGVQSPFTSNTFDTEPGVRESPCEQPFPFDICFEKHKPLFRLPPLLPRRNSFGNLGSFCPPSRDTVDNWYQTMNDFFLEHEEFSLAHEQSQAKTFVAKSRVSDDRTLTKEEVFHACVLFHAEHDIAKILKIAGITVEELPTKELESLTAALISSYLRYKKWIVSADDIKRVFFRKQVTCSFGEIPYVAGQNMTSKSHDADYLAQKENSRTHLKNLKPASSELNTAKQRTAEKELARKQAIQAHRPTSIYDRIKARQQPVIQDTRSEVRMSIHNKPYEKKRMKLEIASNVIDPSKQGQPKHFAELNLTERNLRLEKDVWDKIPPFVDLSKVVEISSISSAPALHALFPHLPKSYSFTELIRTLGGDHLYLIQLPHNNCAWTSNIFVANGDAPQSITNLASVLERFPTLYILMRCQKEDFRTMMTDMMADFMNQTTWNPLNSIFASSDCTVSEQGVLPVDRRPRFNSPLQITYETWQDHTTREGGGVVIEAQHRSERAVREGAAIFIPIAETLDPVTKLYQSFYCFSKNTVEHGSAYIAPGTKVVITIDKQGHVGATPGWNGRAVLHALCGFDEVAFLAHRPFKEKDDGQYVPADVRPVQTFEPGAMVNWSDSKYRGEANKASRTPVEIVPEADKKVLKTQLQGKRGFDATKNDTDETRSKLEAYKGVFTLNKPAVLPRSSLYNDLVSPPVTDTRAQLLSHQQPAFDELLDNGLRSDTAVLNGSGGSGKSTAAIIITLPYLGQVRVSNDLIDSMNKERDDVFLTPFLQAQAKANREAKETRDKEKAARAEQEAKAKALEAAEASKHADKSKRKDRKSKEPQQPKPTKDVKPKVEKKPIEEEPAAAALLTEGRRNAPPSVKSKDSPFTLQRGRITLLAAQNDTVDDLFHKSRKLAKKTAARRGLPEPLSARFHGEDTEVAAVLAQADFMHGQAPDPPNTFHPDALPSTGLNAKFSESFRKAYQGSEYRGIRDSRFKVLEFSVAWYAIRLLDPDDEQPGVLHSTFTATERSIIRRLMKPLADAKRDMIRTQKPMSLETRAKAKAAAKIGIDWIIARASLIVTTVFHGQQNRFVHFRQAHAVLVEEASRLLAADQWALFSKYRQVKLRFLVGDYRQLGPMLFGNPLLNPFHTQCQTSLLYRMSKAGWPMHELKVCSRFRNSSTTEIARLASGQSDLVSGSEDPESDQEARDLNLIVWKRDTAVLYVNVMDAKPLPHPSGSSYCLGCAIISVATLVGYASNQRSQKTIAYVTWYKAQLALVSLFVGHEVQLATQAGKHDLAKTLGAITLSTVDSFMGAEADRVVLDCVGKVTEYTLLGSRVNVAFTRMRDMLTVVGETNTMKEAKVGQRYSRFHALLDYFLESHNRVLDIDQTQLSKYRQYDTLLGALGVDTDTYDGSIDFASLPPSATACLMGYDEEDFGEDDFGPMAWSSDPQNGQGWGDSPDASTKDNTGQGEWSSNPQNGQVWGDSPDASTKDNTDEGQSPFDVWPPNPSNGAVYSWTGGEGALKSAGMSEFATDLYGKGKYDPEYGRGTWPSSLEETDKEEEENNPDSGSGDKVIGGKASENLQVSHDDYDLYQDDSKIPARSSTSSPNPTMSFFVGEPVPAPHPADPRTASNYSPTASASGGEDIDDTIMAPENPETVSDFATASIYSPTASASGGEDSDTTIMAPEDSETVSDFATTSTHSPTGSISDDHGLVNQVIDHGFDAQLLVLEDDPYRDHPDHNEVVGIIHHCLENNLDFTKWNEEALQDMAAEQVQAIKKFAHKYDVNEGVAKAVLGMFADREDTDEAAGWLGVICALYDICHENVSRPTYTDLYRYYVVKDTAPTEIIDLIRTHGSLPSPGYLNAARNEDDASVGSDSDSSEDQDDSESDHGDEMFFDAE